MLSAIHVAESLRDSEEPQLGCSVSLGEADLSWWRSARSVFFRNYCKESSLSIVLLVGTHGYCDRAHNEWVQNATEDHDDE